MLIAFGFIALILTAVRNGNSFRMMLIVYKQHPLNVRLSLLYMKPVKGMIR